MSTHEHDDEGPELVELENDQGETLMFELLAVMEVEGELYAALTPYAEDLPEAPAVDIHVFRYHEHDPEDDAPEGSWSLSGIEDEALEERVFAEIREGLLQAMSEEE